MDGHSGAAQTTRVGLPPRTRAYVYKTRFHVPADFAGKRVLIRFEGVTGTARVWVNGTEIEGHHGGFSIWNGDITDLVAAGESAWLTVAVEEPTKETSTNTYTGGILRDVKLLALPASHLTRLHIDTDLDEDFRDATLRIWMSGVMDTDAPARVELTLTAPERQCRGVDSVGPGTEFRNRRYAYRNSGCEFAQMDRGASPSPSPARTIGGGGQGTADAHAQCRLS